MARASLIGILLAASMCGVVLLIYVSSVESARTVSQVSGADEDANRALELVLERGAIGYLGG
tara:strand:- start:677 stop:862 length:186 start_codon:yes stop_codon:yes gene_type:complete